MKNIFVIVLILKLGLVHSTPCEWRDDNNGYRVNWTPDPLTLTIQFRVEVNIMKPNYWTGIGFSRDTYMANTDVVMGFEDGGQVVLLDMWSANYGAPVEDKTSHLISPYGERTGNKLQMTFKRAFDTGDPEDITLDRCFYMIFPTSGGRLTKMGGRMQFSKHDQTPIAYGRVCLSSCRVSGYSMKTGACSSPDLMQSREEMSLQRCKTVCDSEPRCQAFEYQAQSSRCSLKTGTCPRTVKAENTYVYVQMNTGSASLPNTPETMPSLFPEIPGYRGFNGNCVDNTLGSCDSCRTVQSCAVMCDRTAYCQGFSFVIQNFECYLKSTATCRDVVPTSSKRFYGKIGELAMPRTPSPPTVNDIPKDYGKEISGYRRLQGNCPKLRAIEVCTRCSTPNSCGERCASFEGCQSFSFDFSSRKCLLQSESCTKPIIDGYRIAYEKQEESAYARPDIVGYYRMPGDCPMATVLEICIACRTPRQCGQRCSSLQPCMGFSFAFREERCEIKSQMCENAQYSQEITFYRKTIPTFLRTTPVTTTTQAIRIDTRNMWFKIPVELPWRTSYAQANEPRTRSLIVPFKQKIYEIFQRSVQDLLQVDIPRLEYGSIIFNVITVQSRNTNSRDVARASEALVDSLQANNGQLQFGQWNGRIIRQMTVEFRDAQQNGRFVMFNFNAEDVCVGYRIQSTCRNQGQCEPDSQRRPSCRCTAEWRGTYCETPARDITGRTNCVITSMTPGDRIDNDCDGRVDEEICYDIQDADGDGLPNEDCGPIKQCTGGTVALGSKFLLMFMDNFADDPQNLPLEIYVTNADIRPVSVKIHTPKFSLPPINFRRTLRPGEISRFEINPNLRMQGTGRDNKGILVETEGGNILVYGMNKERYTNDGFLGLPIMALGTEYFAVTYSPPTNECEIGVAALEDGTSVTITLPEGQGEMIKLDKYQTYQRQSKSDMTGTMIKANKPVAVFSGNRRTSVGVGSASRDHLVEQLTPVNSWGTEFVLVPTPKRTTGDIIKIVASQPATQIVLGDGKTLSIDTAGRFQQMQTDSRTYHHLKSNKPIMVVQIVQSQTTAQSPEKADPSMIIIPPVQQYDHRYVFATTEYAGISGSYDYYLMLVLKNRGEVDYLRLDGAPVRLPPGETWHRVQGTDYVASYIQYERGDHTMISTNNAEFGAFIYAAGDRESYGFPAGMRLGSLFEACRPCEMEPGDKVDNDCDGQVDEEECDKLDNDNDGLIDEDCKPMKSICQPQKTTEGTEFVIMYMENLVDQPRNYELELEVTSPKKSRVEIDISAPKAGNINNGRPVQKKTYIEGGDIIKIKLPMQLRAQGTGISNKAVRIKASESIVVYGINKETYSNDGFLALPTNVLGTSYYIVSYAPPDLQCQFGVAAIEDSTLITVRFGQPTGINSEPVQVSYDRRVYRSNDQLSITLEKYQTFQAQTKGDLTGTHISSSKPVAVFSGNVRTSVARENEKAFSRDHLVAQLPPVNVWGKRFITVPIPKRTTGDYFRMVASQSNTRIQITGQPEIFLARPGDYKQILLASSAYTLVNSNQPILLAQIVLSQRTEKDPEEADPSMILIPPVEQYKSEYTLTTSTYAGLDSGKSYTNYLMLITQEDQTQGLRHNGRFIQLPPGERWHEIMGTNYVAGYIIANKGRNTLRHTNPLTNFGAILYGAGDRESYGYPAGMKLSSLYEACVPCKGDPGDGIDNDCDGKIDEEPCDNIDNDGDGLLDEDCSAACIPTTREMSEGREFNLMFMENRADQPKNLPLEIYITTSQKNAVVRGNITMPKLAQIQSPIYFSVKYGNIVQKQVPNSLRMLGTAKGNQGIFIQADHDIVVYGINKDAFTNDGFLGLPTAVLGKEYYAVTHYPPTNFGEIGIVADFDQTLVNLRFPYSGPRPLDIMWQGRRYDHGETLTVLLNKHETFQVQSKGDLTGTFISSEKRIAVFSGNVRTSVGNSASRDHLVEQLPPVEAWGRQFLTISTPGRKPTTPDLYVIVASKPNTVITLLNGGQEVIRIEQSGGFVKRNISSNLNIHIRSNQPIMVIQIIYSQLSTDDPDVADPSMMVIPPIEQYDKEYTFATTEYAAEGMGKTSGYRNYLMIAGKRSELYGLILDNTPLSGVQWRPMPESDYMAGFKMVSSGVHHITHNSPEARFAAYMYGAGDRESYAFPVGMKLQKINAVCNRCPASNCDQIDNDCDGKTDEEICGDNIDNDRDGEIDEDCCNQREPKSNKCISMVDTVSEGKDFMIMFMENRVSDPKNLSLEVYVTTAHQGGPVSFTVSVPGLSFIPVQSGMVRFGEIRKILLSPSIRMAGTRIERKAVQITASEKIVVYGINKETFTNDGFLGLPIIVLGKEYYVVAYYPPMYYTQFGIAGVEDDTEVVITLPRQTSDRKMAEIFYNGRTYRNEDKLAIRLSKYDTFQAQSEGDLTGTFIRANKDVAVFSGNARTNVGKGTSRDHLVEQLPPTETWGKDFVTQPIPGRTREMVGDHFRVIAKEQDTVVKVSQRNDINLRQPGDWREFDLRSDDFTHVYSNKPILLIQIVKSQLSTQSVEQADPAMFIIPPTQQYLNRYTFSTTSYAGRTRGEYTNYLLLSGKRNELDGLILDERPLNGIRWNDIPGTEYAVGYKIVGEGAHNIYHANAEITFGAIMYGAGDRESYAFPAGMRVASINRVSSIMSRLRICEKCPNRNCDGLDNDCDGKMDEEQCDGLDDDNDGQVDEDCCTVLQKAETGCQTAKTVIGCVGESVSISCAAGEKVRIIQSHFGRIGRADDKKCVENPTAYDLTPLDCEFLDIYHAIAPRCDSRPSCKIHVVPELVGTCANSGPCKLCSKYAEITYICSRDVDYECSNMASIDSWASLERQFTASSFLTPGMGSIVKETGSCVGAREQSKMCTDSCTAPQPSFYPDGTDPYYARFSGNAKQAWCPSQCDKEKPFIQMDLGAHYRVRGVVTQGRRKYDQWVTRYSLAYSMNGNIWQNVQDGPASKIFSGNTDARSVLWCPVDFRARYVRLRVLESNDYPCLHLDFLRCSSVLGCKPLNIANSNITAEPGIMGQMMTVQCDDRFTTVNSGRVYETQCRNDGSWTKQSQCDLPIECGPIPAVQNALHNGATTKINARVTYTCQQGYRLSGRASIVCQNNGTWETPPQCF